MRDYGVLQKQFVSRSRTSSSIFALASYIGVTLGAGPALAIDWSGVDGKTVTLFYPGQASWEWSLTKADHSGAPKFRGGKNCRGCHEGEEGDIGDLIVSGEKLEPVPIAGKRGSIPVQIKTAHDADKLYFQFQWKAQDLPSVAAMDADDAAKVTVMLDDGSVVEAARAGCWGVCHDDATNMASNSGEELEKYLARSRTKLTRSGGGLNFKSDADLAAMMDGGEYLEYWQAQLNPGAPAKAVSGYILKDRTEHTPPKVSATADYKDGVWTVELSRALQTGDGHYKALEPEKTYHVGFAIHDAHAANRFHHVSFEHTLVLDGGDADFVAAMK